MATKEVNLHTPAIYTILQSKPLTWSGSCIAMLLLFLATYSINCSKILAVALFISSCSLLYSSFKIKHISPTNFYFGLLLWLGTYVKLICHTVLTYPYKEPIGLFDHSLNSFDQVILVIIVTFMALTLFNVTTALFKFRLILEPKSNLSDDVVRILYKLTPYILVPVVAISCLFNLYFIIHVVGVRSQTQLIWPMNAIISFLMNIGFCLLALFFWQIERKIDANTPKTFFTLICSAMFTSIFCLSRGMFLFQTLPFLVFCTIYFKSLKISASSLIQKYIVTLIALLICLQSVSFLRTVIYSEQNKNFNILELVLTAGKNTTSNSDTAFVTPNAFAMIASLSVDRWVGLEGIMSVVGYPEKSRQLIFDSLKTNQKNPSQNPYERISSSIYKKNDVFLFQNIPGLIAFTYYSGELLLVFLGILTTSLILFLFNLIFFSSKVSAPIVHQLSFFVAYNTSCFFGDYKSYSKLAISILAFLVVGFILVKISQINYSFNNRILKK